MFEIGDFVVKKSEPSTVFRIIAMPLCMSEPSVLLKPIHDDNGWVTGCRHDTLLYAEPEQLL